MILKANIHKILKVSSIDGPGNRMVIFMQGCNFRCSYCHNPETIPITSDESREISVIELIEEIKKVKDFITGVTFSGGEATLQYKYIIEVAKKLKELSLTVLVDTNGHMSEKVAKELTKHIDGHILDIKSVCNEEHKKLTGKSCSQLLNNMNFFASEKKLYEVRTVVVKELLNNKKTVEFVSRFIQDKSPTTRYKLIKFRNHGTNSDLLTNMNRPSDIDIDELISIGKQRNITILK